MIQFYKFLAVGVIFVGLQEFWVTVLWRGDIIGFVLAVILVEVPFLAISFALARWIETRKYLMSRWQEPLIYGVTAMAALVIIEWLMVGNFPGGEASQITMFSTWGGAVVMARIFTKPGSNLPGLRRAILVTFVPFAVLATILGVALPSFEMRFAITYLAANLGYIGFNIFFLAFFWAKWRRSRTEL